MKLRDEIVIFVLLIAGAYEENESNLQHERGQLWHAHHAAMLDIKAEED